MFQPNTIRTKTRWPFCAGVFVVATEFSAVAQLAVTELERKSRRHLYKTDPIAWAEEFMGVQLWSAQKEIMLSVRDKRATAVAAGHGVGKSWIAALLACWWIDVHPLDDVYVASTAPTVDQVTAVLWRNIRNFHNLAKQRFEAGLTDHRLPGYVTGDNRWKTDDGILIGQGRKPADDRADVAFQGIHATYLLAIGDEAVGLNAEMIGALGNIATGAHNRQLLIANPTDPTCQMAQIWTREIAGWNRMHISVLDSPLITKEAGFDASRAQGMSGQEYVDDMRDTWGEDHPIYIARVTGQWAFDAGMTVLTEADVANAVNACVVADPLVAPWLGCDIAWSAKGDFSSVYSASPGVVWETDEDSGKPTVATAKTGWVVRRVAAWQGAPLAGGSDENPSNGMLIDQHALGLAASRVKIDSSGVGIAVVQDLASEVRPYDIYKMAGGSPAREKATYTNARAEAFFDIKILAHQGLLDLDGADEDMIDQLRSVQYEYDSRNKIKIESKADMRSRGRKSPDFADAVWYALYDADPDEGKPQKGDVVAYNPYDFIEEIQSDVRGLPV